MRTFGLTNNEKDETGLWVPAQIFVRGRCGVSNPRSVGRLRDPGVELFGRTAALLHCTCKWLHVSL